LSIFRKPVEKIQVSVKTKVVEYIKTHISCSVSSLSLSQKSCRGWDNAEKCWRAWQATVDNMARAHCMLDT